MTDTTDDRWFDRKALSQKHAETRFPTRMNGSLLGATHAESTSIARR